ncbi:DUF481 domain-containing protein [Litchfieldella xinjiangensis]|uniref:DUF481 domain-containing protein n=1 Tax=Litchfieldella xinjiangensis TaxID=1166948 RepID=UPI0005BBC372|nr:DUF481 domain-containing protein [Halomonas xinjiangensis]
MRCHLNGLVFALLASLISTHALASPFYSPPAPDQDAPAFSGDAELGYTHLSGNTDSQTLIAKGRFTWLKNAWTHTLRGEIRSVTQGDSASAEQYLVAGRERYDLDGPHYLFGFARWERDRFAGYDHQLTTIAGYGRQLLLGETHQLSVETGPGFRFDGMRIEKDERHAVAYAAMDYRWEVSEQASVSQEASVETTGDNVTVRSLSSITARLNSRLALRLSHEIRRNSQPPDSATAQTDQTTSASLLYSW